MNVGCQFSSGDQGPNRQIFAASSYRVCPQCKGKDIKNDKHCAGGRRNGDAYGTEVFTCQTCQWETSFMYDEDEPPYFYETRYWDLSTPTEPEDTKHGEYAETGTSEAVGKL